MRTAGTTVSSYFGHVLSQRGYSIRTSWFQGLKRDWTQEEMKSFVEAEERVYVHNHVRSWSEELVDYYQSHGYFIFCFVRDVGDQLCSLYHWERKRSDFIRAMSLDTFLQFQLQERSGEGLCHADWAIPDYWRRLDYVEVFSPQSFETLAKFVAEWDPTTKWLQPQNSTPNSGYRHYCQQGRISRETQELLAGSVFQERFEAIQSMRAAIACPQRCHAIPGMETDCNGS